MGVREGVRERGSGTCKWTRHKRSDPQKKKKKKKKKREREREGEKKGEEKEKA